ncbi:hypothetical protein [Simplicispira suum]|nr:hypothetical protein [Simplicispira suum]
MSAWSLIGRRSDARQSSHLSDSMSASGLPSIRASATYTGC